MMKSLMRDTRSEGYADVAISLLIMVVFVVSLASMVPIFTTQINLNNTVNQVARVVELEGKADTATINKALSGCYEPDTITVDAKWFSASTKTIQIKERFDVYATKNLPIVIMRPAISQPVSINIEIGAYSTGVSEVYWKK